MAVGQVGFHDLKKVITVPHVERDRETINRLNKTKVEEEKHESDLQAEREEFMREVNRRKKELARQEAAAKQAQREAYEKAKHERDYARIFEHGTEGNVKGVKASEDQSAARQFEEDFM